MGMFSLFGGGPSIDDGVRECKSTPDSMLLDVRTPSEYQQGHIEGSVNVPLQRIVEAPGTVPQKDTPLFVYCLSGSRSARAVAALKQMGYENAKNIGGINLYSGKLVQ